MSSKKKSQMKIKVTLREEGKTDTVATFLSRAAFAQSSLWQKIKEEDSSGTVKVEFSMQYWNEANFANFKDLKQLLEVFTEKELVDEFAKA